MDEHYEEWAAETLSYAKDADTETSWREFFEEVASELLSLSNLARAAA